MPVRATDPLPKGDALGTHCWGAELGFESADLGKDPTTEPDLMMLWNVLTGRRGRGTDRYPKITY